MNEYVSPERDRERGSHRDRERESDRDGYAGSEREWLGEQGEIC